MNTTMDIINLSGTLNKSKFNKTLLKYNQTEVDIPDTTLHALFDEMAEKYPSKKAVVLNNASISYHELLEKSNQIAAYLNEQGIQRGDTVAVYAQRCIETIVNIMGIIKSGAAYVPVDPEYPEERRNYIIENSDCKINLMPEFYTRNAMESYPTDTNSDNHYPEDLAYIIYTSGSTGKPKGVMITHDAVCNTIIDINQRFGVNKTDAIIGISSMCFDLSVYDIFGALSSGATLCIVPDHRDIDNILSIIEKEEITIWNTVPAIMDMLIDYVERKEVNQNQNVQQSDRDNKKYQNDVLRLIMMSGDWIPVKLPMQIKKYYTEAQQISLGGATEASIWSIYFPIEEVKPEWKSIPYGMPLANQQFYVLNYNMQNCPVGTAGELYIGGKGIAKGYANDQEKTNGAFIVHQDYGCIYKTGDYGILKKEGYIEFLGRKDNQVKIKGHRIELGEIESCLNRHKLVRNSVVVDQEDDKKNKFLCAYVISDDKVDVYDLKGYLASFLPDYMIPSYFIPIVSIPLNANGKVDRKGLPKPDIIGAIEMEYVPPQNKIEEKLVSIVHEILGIEKISVSMNFFELGVNSISMFQIVSKVCNEFNINLNFRDFIGLENISELATFLSKNTDTATQVSYPTIVKDEANMYEPFPLTEIQMAYLMGRENIFEMGGVSTHGYIEVETTMGMDRLNTAINKVIERHHLLRAIVLKTGEQRILKEVPQYKILLDDLRAMDTAERDRYICKERERMSHHVFKPDQWPLFEIKALQIKDSVYYLFIGYDLLIADGASMYIINKEILEWYYDPDLVQSDINISFRDYILAYEELKKTDTYKADKKYWLEKVEDFPSAPQLPLAIDPTTLTKPHFKRLNYCFNHAEWEIIKNRAKKENVTTSVLLCTAFAEVLSYWSNQARLAINLTLFNRYPFHEDVNKLVGDFTSVILLDVNLENGTSIFEKARKVQNVLMESLEHRHFEGVEFIRELSKRQNQGTKAIMPIVFTSLLFDEKTNTDIKKDLIGNMKMGVSQTSQVYLDHQASDSDGVLNLNWDYVTELFESKNIETMFNHYVSILSSIVVGDTNYEFTFADEDVQLLMNYNSTYVDFKETTLTGLINEQVSRTPNNNAVIFEDDKIIYQELHERSNQIARYLLENEFGRNNLIGVLAERCINTIVNIVGILKSGAAYVPIDPAYPKDRREYILSNSKCQLMLEPSSYQQNEMNRYSCEELDIANNPDDIAYVIYTSGSTGRPKGVIISHKAAVNTIMDINQRFNITQNDRFIGISSMCFDLSVYDIFGALSTGATLVMIADQRDAGNIIRILDKHKITVWNSVPAIMDMVIEKIEARSTKKKTYEWDSQSAGKNQMVQGIKKKNTENVLYWSPVMHWDKNGDTIVIGSYQCPDFAVKIFPQFYFLTNRGMTGKQLHEAFPEIDKTVFVKFITELSEKKILTSSILTFQDIFSSQDKLFDNHYGESILYDAEKYNAYKYEKLGRNYYHDHNHKTLLNRTVSLPSSLVTRKTIREFDEDTIMTFEQFSKLLSVYMQRKEADAIRYNYASAGGLYPIDVYVFVKDKRVENLNKGLYYYSPIDNSLYYINDGEDINESSHYYTNRSIFKSSAISIFYIYNASVTMPKYGGQGYYYAGIDTGIMVATFTQLAETMGIGVCSIGDMNFAKIEKIFNLTENQTWLHVVEAGIMKESVSCNREDEISITSKSVDRALSSEPHQLATDMLSIVTNEQTVQKSVHTDSILNMNEIKNLDKLRIVMLSGDWIPLYLPAKINRHFKNAKLISLGGATEGSIWSIYYPVNQIHKDWKSIPYGWPLANQQFYVLNYNKEHCPVNIQGELYIGGAGLSEGYLNEKEKTAYSFIDHPKYGKIYRTGDYGILRSEGYIEFLGRKDNQIKIRGHRIELGEIENRVLQYDSITNSVVTFNSDTKGQFLCAYYVTDRDDITSSELRDFLSKALPVYMIPSYFLKIDHIPLTPNGKVDRKALPEPDTTCASIKEYVAPRNKIEQKLVELWEQKLNLDKVGITDNFFEIGGDSLLLIKAHNELEILFPGKVKIVDLFTYPSIDTLAEFISDEKKMVNFDIHGIELSENYFITEQDADVAGRLKSDLKFKIGGDLLGGVNRIARVQEIHVDSVLLTAFAYLFAKISNVLELSIQSGIGITEKNRFYTLVLNMINIKDFNTLYQIVKSGLNDSQCTSYHVNDLKQLVYHKNEKQIVPLFYNKDNVKVDFDLMTIFDLAFELHYENNETIEIVCEFDANRIKEEKVEYIINNYLTIINGFIKYNDSNM